MEQLLFLLSYIVLGIIQGLTEPLPISSSGHLVIVQHFFGIQVADLHFEVFLNGASLLAVLIVYRKDLLELLSGTVGHLLKPRESTRASFKLAMLLIAGTIPAVVAGGLFADFFGGELKSLTMVASALFVTGIVLWLIRKLRGSRQEADITWLDAVIIGLAQTLALAPGISRSGATVAAALARKLNPETALKFSFFLSIPVSVGSLVFEGKEIAASLATGELLLPYLTGFLTAFLVSILAIKWFIRLVKNGNLHYFAIYCFTVSILLLVFG